MNENSKNEINLLDAIEVVAIYKKLVLTLVFSITTISLIASLIWPQTFRSTAIILPPTQQQSMTGISGIIGGMLPLNLGGSTQVNPEVMIIILNSRSMRVELIDEFNLNEVYNSDILEELLMRLNDSIKIDERREGGFGFNPIISVQLSVIDEDPARARDMARYMVKRLDERVREINRKNAVEQFTILEGRYLRNLREMELAEQNLKEFQEEHGIIEVEEQARALIGAIAEIKTQIIETEISLRVLEQMVDPNNPQRRTLALQLTELNNQYDRLTTRSDDMARRITPLHPMQNLPELALEYYRLFREVTVQNKVYETLYPQYDIQKLQLESERRGIQVLDEPHLPTYKDSPKRAFIVLGGMVFSIFLSLLIVFYRHTMETGAQSGSDRYNQIKRIQQHLRFRK